MTPEKQIKPEEIIDVPVPSDEEFASIMESIENNATTEQYIGPGPTRREINIKAKSRAKDKLARKARRNQRKRKK